MTESLFRIRDYRHLFSAQLVALAGNGLATVALGLLAYSLAGSDAAAVLGTALTIKMLTYVLVSPIAGAFANQFNRRHLLVVLDMIRAGMVAGMLFADQVWHVLPARGTHAVSLCRVHADVPGDAARHPSE